MTADAHRSRLATLDQGFRSHYLDYDELTAQVRGWAEAFPDIVRVSSIGETDEGRSIWLLTIGPEPDRVRPAVWVDGNMHASELCGSSVALAIAEDMVRVHLGLADSVPELAAPVLARLRDVLFYVVPRMSPDGAECVLTTGRFIRSSPRDERPNRNHTYWRSDDVDGDGLALKMRVRDAGGEFVESSEIPGLLVLRGIDDPGPYYKVYPEGFIENFDGHTIPTPNFLSDNQTDLNRNFPWSWMPGHKQIGAGSFPMSEPESRAVVEFTSRHPHIFAWLNLHTFGGVFIRPLGDKPDTKMNKDDLALYRQIGAWAKEFTSYPMVSGFEDFTYEPDKPLHGDLTDYAYHQRGCVAYVVELWDLFHQAGIDERPFKRFVERYTHITQDDLVRVARWDREHNQGRCFPPWKPYDHPQLGAVEIGGLDPRFGLWNPPVQRLAEVCQQQSAAFLRVAALAPAITVSQVSRTVLSDECVQLSVTIENRGYLPSYVLSSARDLEFCEPLYATAMTDDCQLDDPSARHREIGHLDGWGRGLSDGTGAFYYMISRGTTGARTLTYTVRGKGRLTLRIGSCRTGWIEHSIELTGA